MFIEKDNVILVADSDHSLMRSMQALCGDEAMFAYFQDGREAIQFLKENCPKLVVIAEDLTNLSGKQVINGMRYTRHLKDVPAVLVTTNPSQTFKDATKIMPFPLEAGQMQGFLQNHLKLESNKALFKTDPGIRPKHVFIVEDSQTVSTLLQHILGKEGFTVTKAETVDSAKSIIEKQLELFDLAILDVNLPGGTGFDLLELIRSKSQLPTVILSSLQSRENIDRSMALGAEAFIPKPFNPRDFIKRIKTYIA